MQYVTLCYISHSEFYFFRIPLPTNQVCSVRSEVIMKNCHGDVNKNKSEFRKLRTAWREEQISEDGAYYPVPNLCDTFHIPRYF
jgi:hypothetical protein